MGEENNFNIISTFLKGLAGKEENLSLKLDGLTLQAGSLEIEFHGEIELDIKT